MSPIKLDPVEWDFREIASATKMKPEHLWILIDYEYARESVRFVNGFLHWTQKQIQTDQGDKLDEFQSFSDGGERIGHLLERGFDKLSAKIQRSILADFPDGLWNDLHWLVHFPLFPKAFAQADSGWRREKATKQPIHFERLAQRMNYESFSLALPTSEEPPVADVLPISPQLSPGCEVSIDPDLLLYEELQTRRFSDNAPAIEVRAIYRLCGVPICTPGNLQVITAPPKAGKTAFLTAMLAASMAADSSCDLFGLQSENPNGFAVLHFDTEQSPDDHRDQLRRALKRAKRPKLPPWLESYCLTGETGL